MSRRKNRRRKRAIIIVTAALLLLFAAVLITQGSPRDSKNESKPPLFTPEVKDELLKIVSVPESYSLASGKEINLEELELKAEYKSGKSENIKEDAEYLFEGSDSIKIEGKKILVSQDALTADNGVLTISYKGKKTSVEIKVFNSLSDNVGENGVITNADAYDMVVNKSRNLPSDYIPKDLVKLDDVPTALKNPEINQLRKAAYDALKELFAKAKEEKSFVLYARSGYRSYNTQESLYGAYAESKGQAAADKFSARPGQSEHQSGLAIDITCEAMNYQLDDTFFNTEEGKWVAENAHRFGFIIRYPKGKEEITGYQYEPWHLRYVGNILAKEVYESGLTLEEYFQR